MHSLFHAAFSMFLWFYNGQESISPTIKELKVSECYHVKTCRSLAVIELPSFAQADVIDVVLEECRPRPQQPVHLSV